MCTCMETFALFMEGYERVYVKDVRWKMEGGRWKMEGG